MSEYTKINFNIPNELLNELDDHWRSKYNSRTEFITAAIREKLYRDQTRLVLSTEQTEGP